jgi:predicted CXXCH cytochrome family protein
MTMRKTLQMLAASAFMLASTLLAPALAQNPDCAQCHADLANKKFVHAAVQMGCNTCHSELDASAVPHKSRGKFAKGLKAEGAAVCTTCHEPKMFEGKLVHAPVAAGMCSGCHNPHSSDYVGLAPKAPAEQCFDCHADVKKRPHVIVGFSGGGHPLGDAKKVVADPLRDGKPFYCASCHEPHRSTLPRLMRFEGKGMASCQKCHKM